MSTQYYYEQSTAASTPSSHLEPAQVFQPRYAVRLQRQDFEVGTHAPQQLNPLQVLLRQRELFQLEQYSRVVL